MAIYNSIALGNAKGKLGNVVMYRLNGQNVVREWIKPPNNRLPNQQINRNRMRNCVHAYQFLKGFLYYSGALSSNIMSAYNGFVKATKEMFPDVAYFTPAQAASLLCPGSTARNDRFNVTGITYNGDFGRVLFQNSGYPFISGFKIILCSWDDVTEEYQQEVREIYLNDWAFQHIDFPDSGFHFEFSAAYLFPDDQDYISNIYFIQGNNG
jgi:hypothetical protein